MAIRYVDSDEGAKPIPPHRTAPEAPQQTRPERLPEDAEAPSGDEAPLPGLPHAKPEPKPRGRKKPLSAAGAETRAAADAAAPLFDGLLPGLQVHAKPTPKPRGRKKAFG